MKNLVQIIQQNRSEAIQLVKQCGGRIDFVHGVVDDKWDGDISDYDTPSVISCDDIIEECAILSVKVINKKELVFLAYNISDGFIRWIYDYECSYNTENEVYLSINDNVFGYDPHTYDVVTDENYEYNCNKDAYNKQYKDVEDAGCEIYAIYLNAQADTHLFDVDEEDFIRMADFGLIHTEGVYFLLQNKVTFGEVDAMRKAFGCCFDDILDK